MLFILIFLFCVTEAVPDLNAIKRESSALFLEENGDQTTVSSVNKDVSAAMGNQLLDILDLDDTPKVKRTKRHETMATYMADFYEKMDEEEHKASCNNGNCELHEWVAADGIVSISPEHVENMDGDVYKLRFSGKTVLTAESSKKTLIVAQLQIFLTGHQFPLKIWVSNKESFDKSQVILSPTTNHVTINITDMIGSWLKPNGEPTLYLRLDLDGHPATEPMQMEAFVVVAFREAYRTPIRPRNRRSFTMAEKSSTNSIPSTPKKQRKPALVEEDENEFNGCRKHGLYVSFDDLNWTDWLIAPAGYSAYFCGGTCEFPLHNRMNATNHAIVQTLAHLVDPERAPKAKCAPVQLAPLKILFTVNSGDVVMKRFRDMVVTECGCN